MRIAKSSVCLNLLYSLLQRKLHPLQGVSIIHLPTVKEKNYLLTKGSYCSLLRIEAFAEFLPISKKVRVIGYIFFKSQMNSRIRILDRSEEARSCVKS
jgi:hypothetical protein